jgi:hypothetical protein
MMMASDAIATSRYGSPKQSDMLRISAVYAQKSAKIKGYNGPRRFWHPFGCLPAQPAGGAPAPAAADFIGYFISKSYNVLTFIREIRTCKKKAEKPADGGRRTAMSVPPQHLEFFIVNR